MAEFAVATFSGTDGTDLPTADSNWTEHPSFTSGQHVITDANRARPANTSSSGYYHSGTPSSADYEVSLDLYFASLSSSFIAYVCGRMSTSANTYYYGTAQYGTGWKLNKVIGGTFTQLGSTVSKTFVQGNTYNFKVHMDGDQISLYTEGGSTPTIGPITDTSITDANRAGIRSLSSATPSNSVGIHVDNFLAADLSSGGGTSYTETLTALAENYAAVTDIATYIDAAEAIITAGATADATVQMLEGVLSAAVVAASVTDTAVVVDTVQTGATAEVTVHDTAQMVENAATAVAAEASVTDSIVSGIAENLLASATSLASATDVQLMVDNLTIMAASGASISEIVSYLEHLTVTATSGASVTDVLVTQFVGRYLFVNTVSPRLFAVTVSPRTYITTVGPR